MKKLLTIFLALALVATLAACAAPAPEASPSPSEEPSVVPTPPPSVKPTPLPSPSIPLRDRLFDRDGNVITINEYGHIDTDAFFEIYTDLTTEELVTLAPYTDGASAQSTTTELRKRLFKDFEGVLTLLSELKIPEGRSIGGEQLGFGIGYEIGFDLQSGLLTEEECQIIYADYDLTESERLVLNKIVEGYEKCLDEYGEDYS